MIADSREKLLHIAKPSGLAFITVSNASQPKCSLGSTLACVHVWWFNQTDRRLSSLQKALNSNVARAVYAHCSNGKKT